MASDYKKLAGIGLAGSVGLAGFGLYLLRRQILAQRLGLPPVLNGVRVKRNIPISTADSIKLMTDHYAPKGAKGQKFPTILIRTPYGRGLDAPFPLAVLWMLIAQRFAERGYNVVVQTTRGRYDSEGKFEPRKYERADGQATLEWLNKQPWFNGQVGTWGPSYLGFVQWAVSDSPLIKAMMPIITSSKSYSVTYPDGIFDLDLALRWSRLIINSESRSLREILRNMNPVNEEKALAPAFLHLPVTEADQIAIGKPVPFYREWLENPRPNIPYWQQSDDSGRVPQINVPVHLVSGWYDFMLRQLLYDYQTLKEAGNPPYLTLGPWFHVSPGNFLEGLKEGISWFDAQLKGDKSRLRQKAVRYFVMGVEEWHEAESWPPASQETHYFLQGNKGLSLESPATNSAPDYYRYDPANPTPVLGGPSISAAAGPKDQRELETRPDVLVYTSAPLKQAVEINSWVKLELFVKSSLEHTDFLGRLCDVHPDGPSINVCEGLLRVEPGIGTVQPDGSLKLEIDLWATAQQFKVGHSIRLQVASGGHPHWNRNLGTGEPVATATRMEVADQTIFHDADHPSALILPVSFS